MPAAKRQPYMKWYARDWRGDGALRMCSYAARGLWADLLTIMHDEGAPYGHLTINGTKPSCAQLARMLGGSAKEIDKLIGELSAAGVPSFTDDGVMFSRRMVRDKEREDRDRNNGKGGGNPKLKPPPNGGVNPQDKAHSQKPEPEPKPATTTADGTTREDADQLNRLNKLLGFDETNFTSHAANIRTLTELKADGCDFERHIWPAAQQAAKGRRARSLNYIRAAAIELRDAEKTVRSLPTPFEDTDLRGWNDRYETFVTHGKWSEKWGGKPGTPDCRMPPEILQRENAA